LPRTWFRSNQECQSCASPDQTPPAKTPKDSGDYISLHSPIVVPDKDKDESEPPKPFERAKD